MPWALWTGRLGILLNLIGAVLFLWALMPPAYRSEYGMIAPDDYDPEKERKEWETKAAQWTRRNKIALWMVFVGVALQLIGTLAR